MRKFAGFLFLVALSLSPKVLAGAFDLVVPSVTLAANLSEWAVTVEDSLLASQLGISVNTCQVVTEEKTMVRISKKRPGLFPCLAGYLLKQSLHPRSNMVILFSANLLKSPDPRKNFLFKLNWKPTQMPGWLALGGPLSWDATLFLSRIYDALKRWKDTDIHIESLSGEIPVGSLISGDTEGSAMSIISEGLSRGSQSTVSAIDLKLQTLRPGESETGVCKRFHKLPIQKERICSELRLLSIFDSRPVFYGVAEFIIEKKKTPDNQTFWRIPAELDLNPSEDPHESSSGSGRQN